MPPISRARPSPAWWKPARQQKAWSASRSLSAWKRQAEAVLAAWPVPVSFGGDRACYLLGIDRIQLSDRASFHSPAAFCAASAHEQIHSTGHESRLKRDLGGAFRKARYAREELVAELGAVLLGDRLEIGSEIESHAAYLGNWIVLLKESPKVLFQVLSEARQAADLICPEVPGQPKVDGEAHPA